MLAVEVATLSIEITVVTAPDMTIVYGDRRRAGKYHPLVAALPRQALASSQFKSALKASFLISIEGDPKSLKMEFPFPGRHDARQLADALAR
jgi:hypothetical protein